MINLFKERKLCIVTIFMVMTLMGCDGEPWNNPHVAKEAKSNVYYSSFTESPKTLDVAKAYNQNESVFTAQIYEPVLQYHYLKRPYTLISLTANKMPTVTYFDKNNNKLNNDADEENIAYSIYDIEIKPGIYFQPHPAFVKDENENFLYHQLSKKALKKIDKMSDFKKTDTRELTADDYVYQIKRLANPLLNSPIAEFMSNYIVGIKPFEERLMNKMKNGSTWKDLREFDMEGVKVIDKYRYQIKVKGKYPQFLYWLAMPFFSPIPWEADVFYSQPGLKGKNVSFDWYPVGTGPFMLEENNPNSQMVLVKNPNFRGEAYPTEGESTDRAEGYLGDAGKTMPFIEKFVFKLEKESIPRWNKFLQGYFDTSAIGSDSFDQAIQMDKEGNPDLTEEMKEKGIRLRTNVSPAIFYLGFNMLDDVVGGDSQKAKKLRQAISIAVNYQEYINIFLNGRGIRAQGPIPPGIFGYSEKPNPFSNQSIDVAKKLLAEAGYPDGRNANTGKPLVLHYDTVGSSGPEEKAQFDWMRKQFKKLGIQLNIRATQYNRFQDKMRTGHAQIFFWGWIADYPDPENFLFLLYGPNSKVKENGENAPNYVNEEYDKLFLKMRHMDNDEERMEIIQRMVSILQEDVPAIWAMHPKDFVLSHQWIRPGKPNSMANNNMKYIRIYPEIRETLRTKWNQPIVTPLIWGGAGVFIFVLPVAINYWRRQRRSYREQKK